MPARPARRVALAALLALALAGAGAALARALWQQQRAGADYVPVSATVLESGIRPLPPSGLRPNPDSYAPRIRYRYLVRAREYESDRYAFVVGTMPRVRAQALADAHPPGSTLTAWHDPRDPTQAVLIVAPPGALTAAGILALLVALAWLGGRVVRRVLR